MEDIKNNKAILELAKGMQAISKKALIEYQNELEDIIDSDCHDKNRIEHTLDGMLGFCFDPKMLELYRKLCRYYYDIDQNATAEYVCMYRDMWDPEQKKEWLRAKTNRAKK